MMQHKEYVEIPARTERQTTYVTCDNCYEKIPGRSYNVDEVIITYRTGTSCPEGGSGDELSVDMCGKCFKEKLLPWFQSQGVEPQKEAWDW